MGQELTVVQEVRRQLDKREHEFRALLPAHIPPGTLIRSAQTAMLLNEDLQECTPKSLIIACTKSAEVGLIPDGEQAALVPFNVKISKRNEPDRWEKQAKFVPMVEGLRDLARRSGAIREWKVRLVYSQDRFRHIDGDVESLEHEPAYVDGDQLVKVYSIAYAQDGSVLSRHVMRIETVERIRQNIRNPSPAWKTNYPEMVEKTCLKRHSKSLPKAKDDLDRGRFRGAIQALDEHEDFRDASDQAPRLEAPRLSMHDAARARMVEAVELSALDTTAEREQAPIAETPAPKAARKRRTADERLAEANAGQKAKEPPAASQAPQEAIQQADPNDDARDLTYEAEQRENPEPEFGRETAEQDEPEIEAFRDGWRSRAASKTRVPPRTITSQDVAQAWIAGYDAFQKTVDIGNAPKNVDASEAMLSRMIDKQFA